MAGLRQVLRAAIASCLLLGAASLNAQPASEAFHWVDFRDAKDAPTVNWVTSALKAEKWTSIREIGAQWDAALVITSERKGPQAVPIADTYTIWNVSLAKHEAQPLLRGVNLRTLDWTTFAGTSVQIPELGIIYDDCYGCETVSTFFTTLYYDVKEHAWRARWVRGDQTAPLWTGGVVDGVGRTQVYGLLTEPTGRQILGTWSHFDYGKAKPAEDYVYQYSVDITTGMEQTQVLGPDHAQQMMQRLCKANPGQMNPALGVLARGQDSDLCQGRSAAPVKSRSGRRSITTTPPANNRGKSTPPPARQ
jgi:hypothetical protein